ncbi:MAG TPA: hypothetical protein DD473_02380 [Planctomycetaceae bacterium]|nr:hypothetical protein [Planctomycetaceae bacterium]
MTLRLLCPIRFLLQLTLVFCLIPCTFQESILVKIAVVDITIDCSLILQMSNWIILANAA